MENQFKLHYYKYGKGDKIAIAFHGFGQDGAYYKVFESVLGNQYTIYSFDLPFHGKNAVSGSGNDIVRLYLKEYYTEFFRKNKTEKIFVLGYSIGAKFALNIIDLFPGRIEKVILIAPDGLKINFWYRMATGNWLSRKIFKMTVIHPRFFLSFAELFEKTGLIHSSVTRFAKSQMSNEDQRLLVYRTWIHFRKLNLNIRNVGRKIRDNAIPVQVFIGEKDRIIEEKAIKKLTKKLVKVEIIKLPVGHHNLIEDTAGYLMKTESG